MAQIAAVVEADTDLACLVAAVVVAAAHFVVAAWVVYHSVP